MRLLLQLISLPGQYECVVTNNFGAVVSEVVKLENGAGSDKQGIFLSLQLCTCTCINFCNGKLFPSNQSRQIIGYKIGGWR